jgi:septal ring factor EnvC (AmiA/AmiB activator)
MITDSRKRLRMKNRIARLKTKLHDAERAQRKLETQINNLEDVVWPLREEIASLQNSLGLKVR